MKKSLSSKLINAPYIIWSAIFIIIPLIIVAYFSFTDTNGNFSLQNIYEIPDYGSIFLRSIIYAVFATAITLIMAYPFAYCLTKMKVRTQSMMIMLVMLPMWMNLLIRTYSWTTILEKTGLINTFLGLFGIEPLHLIGTPGAVVLGMVYNYLPYMILPIYTVMVKIDKSLFEAAEDLGSNGFDKFKKVILPLSLPGVISGITMVFVPSVSTFYIADKLGSTRTLMIGDVIQKKFDINVYSGVGAALSLVLMVMILICLAVMNRFSDDDNGGIIV
ncbi:MAG: ABC transporter permease [Acutalibacteraceae bacterium]|nr:ABC transporter permease [Acutalibacteraceae bacterium]